MNHNILKLLCLVLFFGASNLYAQTLESSAKEENEVMSAIEDFTQGKWDIAYKKLSLLSTKYPKNDAVYYYLGQYHVQKKQFATAEDFYELAIKYDPTNYWYQYSLALLYEAQSKPNEAMRVYEAMLKAFPDKVDLYYNLVQVYVNLKKYEEALDVLDKITTIFGPTEQAAIYRFHLLLATYKNEEAVNSLIDYNSKYSSPTVLITLAQYFHSRYDLEQSLKYYNEAIELFPDFTPATIGKANIYYHTDRFEEYFDFINSFALSDSFSVEDKKDYVWYILDKRNRILSKNDVEGYNTFIENCLQKHPGDSLISQSAGAYYYTTKQNEKAVSTMKNLVELYPDSFGIRAGYIEMLMYTDQWEDLSREGRIAFDLYPHELAFIEMASVGDYHLKDVDKVIEACETVIKMAPNDSTYALRAYSTLGDSYFSKGNSKAAFKAYKKALKINPDYIYVLNNYAYYLSVKKKSLKKAAAMSLKTITAEPENPTYLDTYGWILFLQGKAEEAKPYFQKAMIYGGKDSAVIMDHYAEVLFALKEYDLAFLYWNKAKEEDTKGEIKDLDERIATRKATMKKRRNKK